MLYGYDVLGQRVSMMDRSGESAYTYDGLGRITTVTGGSGEVTSYEYGVNDLLSVLTYPDGKRVLYEYDKNDNLTKVTDRTGAETTYVYDAINRMTEIHRPNGVSTYNTYNARDQIVEMKNVCDDCGWVISEYGYAYDDRGFISGETAVESLYGYAWDDKHDGRHENWHDDQYPHGDKHTNKHDKDGEYHFQIIETKREFEYDADGKLLKATETEDNQGTYVYEYEYDDMGNRTGYEKSRNGKTVESGTYTYNLSNQLTKARLYDGKHYQNVEYTYDADGNRILQEEITDDGDRKVEYVYNYTVENRLKAVSDKNDLLAAMAYDGDGNRIFQLNYNLHTDDDWKGNSGGGNGSNKDNTGSGNSGNSKTKESKKEGGILSAIAGFFTGGAEESEAEAEAQVHAQNADGSDKINDNGNNGNNGNGGNGNHLGWENGNSGSDGSGNSGNGNGNSGNNGNNGNGNSGNNGNSGTGSNGDGNTTNTGGSTNQSGILFPVEGEVSELEAELISMIKTTGKEKNYELVEYVNDVNREHTEVLMELNINGMMDTAYSYGDRRLTNERFTEWTGYYTYDPRGSVSGVTDSEGMIWQSYRYNANGEITFGKPQYNNVYAYNGESYNPNTDTLYLRARYYSPQTADFLTEDTYLGDITAPLSLNRYNYVNSSPLNYQDPSGHWAIPTESTIIDKTMAPIANSANATPAADSDGEIESPVAKIAEFIGRHKGALVGAATGVALVVLAAPVSASVATVLAISAAGGAVGISIGGGVDKAIDTAAIAYKLKNEYGLSIQESFNIELSEYPDEVRDLCERLENNAKDMESYLNATTVIGGISLVAGEMSMLWETIGKNTTATSKHGIKDVRAWYEKALNGLSGKQTTFDYVDGKLEDIPSDVWMLGPTDRGNVIENASILKNNLGHNFPVIDALYDRTIESTKSYDTTLKTYTNGSRLLSRIKADLNKLSGFTNMNWNQKEVNETMYDFKRLNVVIPNYELSESQKNALQKAKEYAESLQIELKIYVTQ